MKKYSLKTRKNSRLSSNKKNIKLLFVWLVAILLLIFGLRPAVNVVSSWVTTPFFSIRHYMETSAATVPVFIRSRNELLDDIRSLEQKISTQQGTDNTVLKLTEENESLRGLLQSPEESRIAAGIIARPPYTPYDVVLIDKGSNDAIKEHTPVYYGNNKILGYVEKVFSNNSLVTLLSSPNIETSVYILGPDIFVSALGQGGGVVRLSIPQGIVVEPGNVVITPSMEGGILGDIDTVDSNPSEPEQFAYLTYDVPVQSIRLVGVGTKPLEEISFEEALKIVQEAKTEFLQFSIPQSVDEEVEELTASTTEDISEEAL